MAIQRGNAIAVVLLTLFVMAFGGGIFWACQTHPVLYKVAAVAWTREMDLERYQWKEQSDWADQLEGDSVQILSSSQQIRRWRKVQTGTKQESYYETKQVRDSDGEGYTSKRVHKTRRVPVYKDVPDYDTKHRYRSLVWSFHRTLVASGANNVPLWPELPTEDNVGEDNRPDRVSTRREHYDLVLEKQSDAEGPTHPKAGVSEALFRAKFLLGAQLECPVNNIGSVDTEGCKEHSLVAEKE